MKKLKQLNLKIEINKGFKVTNPAEQPKEDKVIISLRHGTQEYNKRIAHFGSLGAISATLVAAFVEADDQKEGEGVAYEEISLDNEDYKEVIDGIKKDLVNVFTKKENLTPEQKRIAELEATVQEMKNLMSGKAVNTPTDTDLDEITKLRDEYKDLTNQEPDQRWKESRLKKEIEDAKESN